MITIESLLQPIRWDPAFGGGRFAIGYFDRVARRIVTLPLEQIRVEAGSHFSFAAVEPDGSVHDVPFHRMREVHRDGECIWGRGPDGKGGAARGPVVALAPLSSQGRRAQTRMAKQVRYVVRSAPALAEFLREDRCARTPRSSATNSAVIVRSQRPTKDPEPECSHLDAGRLLTAVEVARMTRNCTRPG